MMALLCWSHAGAINPPSKVVTFYNGFKLLENASSYDEASMIQIQMMKCFMASDNSGINIKIDDMQDITSSNRYTQQLFTNIYDRKTLKAVCNITKTTLVEQPDQNRNMQQQGALGYTSYVTKTYTQDGRTKTYYEIVFTDRKSGLITEMEKTEATGNIIAPPPASQQLGIEQLRTRAAYYYTKGMYNLAYNYYEQLVSRVPTDGDASYRIALLTFWRKGCKHKFSSRRAAQNKAKTYMQKAIEYGNAEIREKATNVKNNWENNNVYF